MRRFAAHRAGGRLYGGSNGAVMARACLGPYQPGHAAGTDRGRGSRRGVAITVALTQPITEPDTNAGPVSNAKPDSYPDADAPAKHPLTASRRGVRPRGCGRD